MSVKKGPGHEERVTVSERLKITVRRPGANQEVKAERSVATHDHGRAAVAVDEEDGGVARLDVEGTEFPSKGSTSQQRKGSVEALFLESVERAYNARHSVKLELVAADESKPEQRGWDGFLVVPGDAFDPNNRARTPVWLQETRLDPILSQEAARHGRAQRRYDLPTIVRCVDEAILRKGTAMTTDDRSRTHLVLSTHLLGEAITRKLRAHPFKLYGFGAVWVASFGEEAFALSGVG